MRSSLVLSALLLGLGSSFANFSQSSKSTEFDSVAYRGFLSAQTEQKDEVQPHRGSGRRRFQSNHTGLDMGESLINVES
ncbi:MAG: heterocyst-inhibiting protein PatX [Phormidium sp.]|nr:MAG: hypothetical protein HLUCCO16_04740 [Phormidium sp. OSCR]